MSNVDRQYWVNETIAFLAIASLRGVGFWTMHKIASSEPGFKDLLKADSPERLNNYLRQKPFKKEEWAEKQERLWNEGLVLARDLARQDVTLRFRDEEGFPDSLKSIPDAPYWLFVQGQSDILNKASVAIVGSRQSSNDGIFLTKWVVAAITNRNLVTVSGLAAGIDQCAHLESLKYGIPTIAVLGTGILENYPVGSEKLRERILKQGGAIVSEYLPNQSYSAENFVRRNRIQAALCSTLVPVEWKIKSGTAHTVDFAHKYGKNIANVYLPNTLSLRDEIVFSREERRAEAFQVPFQIKPFLEYVVGSQCDDSEIEAQVIGEDQQGFDF